MTPSKADSATQCLFVSENTFCRTADGDVYSAGPYPAKLWSRFLDHFDALEVVGLDRPTDDPTPYNDRSDRPGVSFVLINSVSRLRRLVRIVLPRSRQIDEAVARSDVVVARLPSENGLLALRSAHRRCKPTAVEVVGCAYDSHYYSGSLAGRLYAPIAAWRTRRAVAQASSALYVTEQFLQERYPATGWSTVASNVDIAPEQAALDARLGLDKRPGPLVFGTIGVLQTPQKGIATALEALASFPGDLDFTYQVLGGGDPAPFIALAEKLGIGDRVAFVGALPSGDGVKAWLDGVDIYLQPSLHEGLPRALVEAMARGCPAIGATAGGIPELLAPAWLHAPGDAQGLAGKIAAMAALSHEARGVLSKENFARASDFAADVLEARRCDFYAKVASVAG